MGIRFFWVYFVAVFVLVACAGDPGGGRADRSAGFVVEGTIPVTVVNKTPLKIVTFIIRNGKDSTIKKDVTVGKAGIAPGGRKVFNLAAGDYVWDMDGEWVEGSKSLSTPHVLFLQDVAVAGPTEVVIYDGTPPTDPPAAGLKQVVVPSWDQKLKDKDKVKNAEASAARNQCTKDVPPKNETPAPGKTKADGKWRCILGGGAGPGADNVNIAQLSDGRIQATITGNDMNKTWEGAVVGDELHFRFVGESLDGGRLKLDPGGRAMSGNAWTYTNEGKCVAWTLTCNKT